jgi:starvation-inducible DNA-binding protein
METLKELMKKVLADTFTLYLKSHGFHWNVEGPNFAQYHSFFNDLYEELHGAVDPIAEHLRTLQAFAPASLKRFSELTEIEEEFNVPTPIEMIRQIHDGNEVVLKTLNMTIKFAETLNKQGLVNFLGERIDIHEKHAWMLRSFLK